MEKDTASEKEATKSDSSVEEVRCDAFFSCFRAFEFLVTRRYADAIQTKERNQPEAEGALRIFIKL
jgi:hypothetical protein